MTGVTEVTTSGQTIRVRFSDQPEFCFHALWLRDRCDCDQCIHRESRQKQLAADGFPLQVAPTAAAFRDGVLDITWSDGHRSRYASEFLARNTPAGRAARRHQPLLWNTGLQPDFPTANWTQVKEDDAAHLDLLKALVDYGVVRVSNVPVEESLTEELASLVSIIRETPHGRIYDVRTLPSVHNLAYSADALSLHVDGSYHYYSPGPMLFHFMETTPSGGETVLVDGFSVARTLEEEDPDAFALLCRLPWHNAYWNAGMDIRAANPPIGINDEGDLTHVILNQYTSFPDHFGEDEIEPAYNAWRKIHAVAARESMQVVIKMHAGEALFFDNRRVLHTRKSFDPNAGPRRLRSCYMDRDSLHSNLRMLAAKLGDPVADAIFTTT